jgi:N-acyl-D-amino-acid deacylase
MIVPTSSWSNTNRTPSIEDVKKQEKPMHDLVIRGATVVDGLGHDPIRADVAVKAGRIAAIGEIGKDASEMVDAGGLALIPGIIDLHTHYDAQVTWDPTLSPSPSLGVTTAIMGNCGFGIVPSPPRLHDLIMRNLAVVEGMDLDALRAGIDWRFQSFAEYMTMLRGRGAYMNLGVLVGHSAVRTAVMGEDASVRKQPTAAELAEMKRLVGEAMDEGAIGLGGSYSLNHSGWGGMPMPSTISEIAEFDALVGAMGGPGRGVVEISSGPITPDATEEIAARHGRRIFMSTAIALYNEQYPERALGVFDACGAAQARGNELYIQITCQPLSFDFTLASAYPFYSHRSFDPIKAYDREQLKTVFGDPSFRNAFRADLRNPKPGTVFQGNWERVIVAAPVKPEHAGLANRSIADIARAAGRDPLDALLDLGLDENLDTGLIGRFFNAVDEGVEPLVKHKAGVIALSDAGAHLMYLCDAGFGLYFLGHWVRERGAFDLPEGVRRLTSHQAGLYGIPDRGRIALGAHADLLLFDPATVGISAPRRVNDLPGGGPRTLRDPIGVHGVFVNGVRVFDGKDYTRLDKGPGQVLDRFLPARAAAIANAAQ